MKLTHKVSAYLVLASTGMIIAIAGINYSQNRKHIDNLVDSLGRDVLHRMEIALPNSLNEMDVDTALQSISGEFSSPFTKAVLIRQTHAVQDIGFVRVGDDLLDYSIGTDLSSFVSMERELHDSSTGDRLGWVVVYINRPLVKETMIREMLVKVSEQAGIVVLLIVILGYLLNKYLVGPLEDLKRSMKGVEVATEDRDHSITEQLGYSFGERIRRNKSFEEIRQIGQSFDSMIAAVSNRESELKLAKEEAEEASRAKEEFLAVISHEMRTPLNPIMGFIDVMLKDGQANSEQQACLDLMKKAGNKLLYQIDSILKYVNFNSRDVSIVRSAFDPWSNIKDAMKLFASEASEKSISLLLLDNALDLDEEKELLADVEKVEQVLYNLIGNAIKYTNQGYVKVSMSLGIVDESNARLTYTIEDTGIGISEDKIEELFKPFTQVDFSLTRNYQGVGLGLAICKKLSDLLDGEIQVSSELGKGSVFRFSLPVAMRFKQSINVQGSKKRESNERFFENKRVLIVEDDPANSILVDHLLNRMGFDATCVESGKEALEIVKVNHFDLILMDLNMPEMDGLEVARRIRAIQSMSEIPIIAVSANVGNAAVQGTKDVGMAGFIPKPVNYDSLYDGIRSQIDWD